MSSENEVTLAKFEKVRDMWKKKKRMISKIKIFTRKTADLKLTPSTLKTFASGSN